MVDHERRATPDRRLNGLTAEMARLNLNLAQLSERVEVANALNTRQTQITRVVRWLIAVSAVLVVSVGLVLVVAVQVTDSSARTQCRALNEANATNARFWSDLLVKFPAVPPGPDATQSERDAYARSQEDVTRFRGQIAALGRQRSCD